MMKRIVFLNVLLLIFLSSCVQDSQEEKPDTGNELKENIDTPQINNPNQNNSDTEIVVVDSSSATVIESIVNTDTSVEVNTGEVVDTASDIDEMLQNKVNLSQNPDNYNMQFSDDDKEYITKLIPLLWDKDKDYYFVQFLVSVKKYPKIHFDELLKKPATIYVVHHEGLYKYSLARYKSKEEAKKYVSVAKEKYGQDDLYVVNYSSAW